MDCPLREQKVAVAEKWRCREVTVSRGLTVIMLLFGVVMRTELLAD